MREDFTEIAHTGGKVTFGVRCDKDGRVSYKIGYSHSTRTPMALVGIYAHPDGFACGNIKLGGIGEPWNPPPLPNCIAVMMASDTHGKFGHVCPRCQKHFRTASIPSEYPLTCTYCGLRTESFRFLTAAQKDYIRHYINTLFDGMGSIAPDSESEIVIDMDRIADATSADPNKGFYYTSITQQTEFHCGACNSYNDIRGCYGYCASCGTRNDVAVLEESIKGIRQSLIDGSLPPSNAVKLSISEFDSALRDYARQMSIRIPMKKDRRDKLERLLFHNLDIFVQIFTEYFGINLLRGLGSKKAFIKKMFQRRHIYEHGSGVADSRYIEESHDDEVEEGALIRETQSNAHELMSCLIKMAKVLDEDFNSIFPPETVPIDIEKERRSRIADTGT
jgi:hypothetical protein